MNLCKVTKNIQDTSFLRYNSFMKLWIDINNEDQINIVTKLQPELISLGHEVVLTCVSNANIKNKIPFEVKPLGFNIKFLDFMSENLDMLRSTFLSDYIEDLKINSIICLGSNPQVLSSVCLSLPIIYVIKDLNEKIPQIYFIHEQIKFLVEDGIPRQMLVNKNYPFDKTANFKGSIKKTEIGYELKSPKALAEQIINETNKLKYERKA